MSLETLQNGRYRILRTLGSGSMGEVYLVEDTRINRQVAIKVIRTEAAPYPDSSTTLDAARLFEREAKAIARLNHPNILPLYDFGEEVVNETTLAYMVMPYCPEGSLASWLQQHEANNRLSPQDTAHFLRQAADALQHAHDNGIIHQDVKPQNFLIRSNKKAMLPDLLLADFGIAKLAVGTSGASQAIRGTPIYMAPEQWEGNPVPASDQYALAVMIYQLMAGQPPFQGGPGQMMYQHFNVSPRPPSTFNPAISSDLDAVMLHALAKRPQDRFASISAFANAFQQALMIEAPTISNTPVKTQEGIQATLAISPEEALHGASRTLTLAGGQRVKVTIPAGTQNGQVIRALAQDYSRSDESATIPLLLTIAIAFAGEDIPTILSRNEETSASGLATVVQDDGKTTLSAKPTILSMNASSNVATPPPAYNNVPPSFPQDDYITPGSRRPRRGMTILLIVLAALLLLGSAGGAYYYFVEANGSAATNNQNNNGTATAQSNALGTSQANGSSTALSQSNLNASATANAKTNSNATATANVQANETATANTQGSVNTNATATAQSATATAGASTTTFTVQSVTVSVNPSSISGMTCGTYVTVTYTATFVVPSNTPGGTVQFTYTVNNGHSSQTASLTFAAGDTTKTYAFKWSGNLPSDHTYPGVGEVITTSPNQVTSNGAQPSGECISLTPTPT